MNEKDKRESIFKEIFMKEEDIQNMVKLLTEGGLSIEQINSLLFVSRSFKNPNGLNDIIFDISGQVVTDIWDNDLHMNKHVGKLTDGQAKRKMRQLWGKTLEEHAFFYLKSKLKSSGWTLKNGLIINNKEYDCIGWKGKTKRDIHHPDLAIEMHFPMPKGYEKGNFPFIVEQTRKMREKLKILDAKYKYVLIGVPQDKEITTTEIIHSDMKIVYQKHKFGKLKLLKQTKLKV